MTRTVDDALAAIEREKQRAGWISWDVAILRDEILRLRALTTWRPIETAPRDGTAVITARTMPDGEMIVQEDYWHPRYEWMAFTIHWLPFPPPPVEATVQEPIECP